MRLIRKALDWLGDKYVNFSWPPPGEDPFDQYLDCPDEVQGKLFD